MNKNVFFHARLTPLERAAVDLIAQREGLNVAEASRFLIREGAKTLGVWPPKSAVEIVSDSASVEVTQ